MVKDKVMEQVEEKKNSSAKSKEQDKNEDATKPNSVGPIPIPFPQRLTKAKLEAKFGKFLEVLTKLQINISFLDAISDMPSYVKFLKEMLSSKIKLQENVMVSLMKECSAILQKKLPPKAQRSRERLYPLCHMRHGHKASLM